MLRLAVQQTVHDSHFIVGVSYSHLAFFVFFRKSWAEESCWVFPTRGVWVGRVLLTVEVQILGPGAEVGSP